MSSWGLNSLFKTFHQGVEDRLSAARKAMGHPVAKGDATETVWGDVLRTYLPKRYQVEKAFVVDSNGEFSQQLDIVIFDRQYSPFILTLEGQAVIPAESVYAAFEAKQSANLEQVSYARTKIGSVRALQRTSLPIPHAGGTHPPREILPILGGLLCLDSDWNPPLGQPFAEALLVGDPVNALDIGCVAAHGTFARDEKGAYVLSTGSMAATTFLFELISRLQQLGTVPMIDIAAYARWLR